MNYQIGDRLTHPTFGNGKVICDQGTIVIVQFEHGIESCEKRKLNQVFTPEQIIAQNLSHPPLPVILHGLAATIDSLNDRWSIFSRSRVRLLPHQLWVCRKVLEHLPFRWLIADDVGLGKTIEAGLILWPLISRKVVKRVLILCPASLVIQWITRLREMFDLRFSPYTTEADTPKSGFWETHNQVVASLQTLRDNRKSRHERLIAAPNWDLVIVDEAHHLNIDRKTGSTLNYSLLQKLEDTKKIHSLIFFTGTPHRGKDYNFLGILKLLRADIFKDFEKPLEFYLPKLREVVIRNNKLKATDLQGKQLFKGVKTEVTTYKYSQKEQLFYDTLTDFISTGQAYASSLEEFDGKAVILVLILLQKIASSSVAAIRRTLKKRLNGIKGNRDKIRSLNQRRTQLQRWINDYQKNEEFDSELKDLEKKIEDISDYVCLMENEEEKLEKLVMLAESIHRETKIDQILTLLENEFKERSILFFTEYKATQSLLMSALIQIYGKDSVVFINGDMEAYDVLGETIHIDRQKAVNDFNKGNARFLVSTEAAGEGVDLQENCYTLIHVDLPWNPMRLHQRIGRLYRYGQSQVVQVVSLRNPDTVEAKIWECLEKKMKRIQLTLRNIMDDEEDLIPMVLGMTSSSIWTELFAKANTIPQDTLESWFDSQTVRFGGDDALKTVKDLVGHCASFDYQEFANHLNEIDLGSLKPFFLGMLALNRRQVKENEKGISFLTPENWNDIGIKSSYSGLVFDRTFKGENADERILGVGNPLLEKALLQGRALSDCVTYLSVDKLPYSLIVFQISDRLTEGRGSIRSVIVGVELQDTPLILRDNEVLLRLNNLLNNAGRRFSFETLSPSNCQSFLPTLKDACQLVSQSLNELDIPFTEPDVNTFVVFLNEDTLKLPPSKNNESLT